MLDRFWVHGPMSFQHMSIWCMFLGSHPTMHHSNIGVIFKFKNQSRHIYLNPEASKRHILDLSKHKITYLTYILSFLANHVKSDPIQKQLVLEVHGLNNSHTLMLLKIQVQIHSLKPNYITHIIFLSSISSMSKFIS